MDTGGGALSLGVKRLGREADHSPPSSAEFRMSGAIPRLLQYDFMAWCTVKAQGQLKLELSNFPHFPVTSSAHCSYIRSK